MTSQITGSPDTSFKYRLCAFFCGLRVSCIHSVDNETVIKLHMDAAFYHMGPLIYGVYLVGESGDRFRI